MRTTSELRDTILGAARSEFAQYGLAGARIDRIAKAADASKERLYAHFGDKETLFRSVVAADTAEFFAAVTLRPDAVPEFVGDIYDLACGRPEHLRMITWANLEGFVPSTRPRSTSQSGPGPRHRQPSKPPRPPVTSTRPGSRWTCSCCCSASAWPGRNRPTPTP